MKILSVIYACIFTCIHRNKIEELLRVSQSSAQRGLQSSNRIIYRATNKLSARLRI